MRSSLLLCAVLVFCCVSIATADMRVVSPSLEFRLADAPCIVRGTVIHVDVEKDPSTGTSWQLNTVRVDEILRGPNATEIIFAESAEGPVAPLQPANSGSRALFFLVPGNQGTGVAPSKYPWILVGHITLQLDPGVAPFDLAVTATFEKVRDPNRLLQLVREISAEPAADSSARLAAIIKNEAGDEVFVPLNARTESYALAWSTSPSVHWRLVAIDILARRKTPNSIRALQSMLSHDQTAVEVGHGPARSRYYCVRAEVATRLKEIGATFSPVRLEEPLIGYSPAPHLVIYLALLLAVAVVVTAAARAPRGRKLSWAFLCSWAIAVVAVSAAWIASEHWEQELVINGTNRHRFDSKDGVLQYTLVHDWPDHGPALIRSFNYAEIEYSGPSDPAARDPFLREEDWHSRFRELPFNLPFENQIVSQGSPDFSISRGSMEDTFGMTRRFERLRIPYSVPMALLALFPAGVLVRSLLGRVRHHMHSRRGLCPNCGYDMRATPDRCPECGRTGEALQPS